MKAVKQISIGADTYNIKDVGLRDLLNGKSTFAGVATPDLDPGTPNTPVFYIANEVGTYGHFNTGTDIIINEGESAILEWNPETYSGEGNTLWVKHTISQNSVVNLGGMSESEANNHLADPSIFMTLVDANSGEVIFNKPMLYTFYNDTTSTLVICIAGSGIIHQIAFGLTKPTNSLKHRFIQWSMKASTIGGTTKYTPTATNVTEWFDYSLGGDSNDSISLMTNITWQELKNLRDENQLTAGCLYRITDYTTTTTQDGTQSANNDFDIIVEAISENTLSEESRAIKKDNDTYFANNDLEAWEIKYCLDNDNTRFGWADTVNGKGVIYYMKDEFNNEAWYDFKNIQFLRTKDWFSDNGAFWCSDKFIMKQTSNWYFYTFSSVNGTEISDDTLYTTNYHATDNHLGRNTAKITKLNNTIFINEPNYGAFNNIIVDGHGNNTFGNKVWNNYIGHNCLNNVIAKNFQYNTIQANFYQNSICGDFTYNTIDSGFVGNIFSGNVNKCLFKHAFANNNFVGENLSQCTFGANNNHISDLPSMTNVTFTNSCVTSTTQVSLGDLYTTNQEQLLQAIKNLNEQVEHTIYLTKDDKYFIFSHNTFDAINNIYDLGDVDSSGSAETKAQNPNISTNNSITLIKYHVPSSNKTGLIEQWVGSNETIQFITWDGKRKYRKLQFQNIGGNQTLINNPSWEEIKIITSSEWTNHVNETVKTNSDQEINGVKTFNDNINLKNKTVIATNIDGGELKVLHNNSSKGFIVRTKNTSDSILPLELLSTNGYDSYQYNFPTKSGTVALLNDLEGFSPENLISTTWSDLKSLRDANNLSAGCFYRITDYTCTTTQADTKSAGHAFDIVVLALSEDTLSEEAKAMLHEGDTYFADCDISAWKLMYCLDNDKTRFEWADETNGKGVIFRMIDKKNNDCPYDFKNILIYNDKYTDTAVTADKYYYTFSYVVNKVLYDGTVESQATRCYDNSMKEWVDGYKIKVNMNTFKNNSFGNYCYSNTFGNGCYSNSFGNSCNNNSLGYNCHNNSFGDSCTHNSLGNNCFENSFGIACHNNTFSNSFGSITSIRNTFGSFCSNNSFGSNFYNNSFGNNCETNKFGNVCSNNSFGNSCVGNSFGDSCSYNSFGDNLQRRRLDSNRTYITLNDEYYDDGSGQLVPIKHPDLSTQPNILPYKFMGNYVYEQLMPIELISFATGSSIYFNFSNLDSLGIKNVLFLDIKVIITYQDGKKIAIPIEGRNIIGIDDILCISNSNMYILDPTKQCYAYIVYTSMPEESGGAYYGYNEYNENSTSELGSITMIFDSSPGVRPISLGIDNDIKKYYDEPPYYIPISDIVSLGSDDWDLVLSESAQMLYLQGYGSTEQEARSTQYNESISTFNDAWFKDKFGDDYQSENIFLYFK